MSIRTGPPSRIWAFDVGLLAYLAGAPADRPVVQQALAAKNANCFALLYTFRERTPRTMLVALAVVSLGTGFVVGFVNRFHDFSNQLVARVLIIAEAVLVATICDLGNPAAARWRPITTTWPTRPPSSAGAPGGPVKPRPPFRSLAPMGRRAHLFSANGRSLCLL